VMDGHGRPQALSSLVSFGPLDSLLFLRKTTTGQCVLDAVLADRAKQHARKCSVAPQTDHQQLRALGRCDQSGGGMLWLNRATGAACWYRSPRPGAGWWTRPQNAGGR
jgi:hypothetical protein